MAGAAHIETESSSSAVPLQRAAGTEAARPAAPPVPVGLVVRRRLIERLNEGVRHPLTLVSAPAGYGKTTLVASWADEARGSERVVRTLLDHTYTSPQDLWVSAVGGFELEGVDVSEVPVSPAAEVDSSMLLALGRGIKAAELPLVWVLDCGEHALPPGLGEELHLLLGTCAGALRLILLTRADPPLPLHRYRLEGSVTEIRASDLAFSSTEVSDLMRRAGLGLPSADIAALHTRTSGWPAGLKFAAMSLNAQSDTSRGVREFRGDTGNVAAYLMSEVLAVLPPEIRDFLLRTCLVEELDAGLATALTGQHCDARVLEFIAHGNSFIEPVPGTIGRYRYQSLFREFLRSQLWFETPARVPVLHAAAAEWYADHGQPFDAIRHAVAAPDWPAATTYFVNTAIAGEFLIGRRRAALRELLAPLPADVAGPEAAVTRAALALTLLDADGCAVHLDAARTLLASRAPAGVQRCLLTIAVLEALMASLGSDVDTAQSAAIAADTALRLAPGVGGDDNLEFAVLVTGCLGRALLRHGDLAAASLVLAEGIRVTDAVPSLGGLRGELQGVAALAEAASGHLRRATELANLPRSHPSAPRAAVLALAWVRLEEYDLQAAQGLLDEAAPAPSFDARMLGEVDALIRARLFLAQGELALAPAALRTGTAYSSSTDAAGWLRRSLLLEEAAWRRAQGRPEEADAVLRSAGQGEQVPLSETAVASASLSVQVSHWLAEAARLARERDRRRGMLCLERALRLASTEHLRRPFIQAPEEVHELLSGGLAARHRWLHLRTRTPGPQDLNSRAGVGREPAAELVTPLTPKEHEVLVLLADLMTTDEIASALFVSVNTVRSHVRSILRKLGVARRNEAVRRAWDLNLLSPRDPA